jgi:hypothetical protein
MAFNIQQRVAGACVLLLLSGLTASAQQTSSDSDPDDPFAAHRWHFEAALQGAVEAWNYNDSHEELYGMSGGLTYGLRDGLVLLVDQRDYYVSQRGNDTWLLCLTWGVRGRVYRRGRSSVFLEATVGVSHAAVAAPPNGTRFNYLALASSGVLVRLRPRLQALAAVQWVHLSNHGLKGPGRNPDIEALGPRFGLVVGF